MDSNPRDFAKLFLNFHKMNRCHFLLEPFVLQPQLPNYYRKLCVVLIDFLLNNT